MNLKDRIFRLTLIRGDQDERSFHVEYIVRTHRERQTSLDGFKAHLDSDPNGEEGQRMEKLRQERRRE